MSMDVKSERNLAATTQEMSLVTAERRKGNVAYRIAAEFDVLVFDKRAKKVFLVECKQTAGDTFYVDKYDIARGLDMCKKLEPIIGKQVHYRIDMYFPQATSNKRKYIEVSPEDRGFTICCTKGDKNITTKRVQRGKLKKAKLSKV